MNKDEKESIIADTNNKPNGTGLTRVLKATRCSMLGFKAAYKHESAFRQELWLCCLLLPLSFLIATSGVQLGLLIASLLLILLVEIINSAIEAIVDRIGIELHELSGRAKDLGSTAVFLALCIFVVIWAGVIFDNYFT